MAAVATILGLLLVVTFIANYITTTLPSTMGQNDLQHEVTVQNQVAQLSALLQATAQSGAIGAQISAPVTLGSAGAPPFANADSSSISAGNLSAGLKVNFTVAGPTLYAPPTGFPAGNLAYLASTCLPRPPTNSVNCAAVNRVHPIDWNFSAGDGIAYTVTLGTGGNHVQLYFATNRSTITISGISGMPTYIQILGSNDTLSINNNGGGNNPISVNITGNYDTITAGSFPGGASTIYVNVIGDHDYINGDTAAGGNTMYVSFLGVADTLAVVPGSGSTYYTYFTGFDVLNPVSSVCPYGALSHSDSVTGYTIANGQAANAHLIESFNNSTAFPGNSTHTINSRWSITNQTVAPFACPFFSQVVLPIPSGGTPPRGGLVVHLSNTYAPSAEVAFDQGAVVYAQPGAIPIFVVPPRISYVNGVLSMFAPRFSGNIGSESGVGTADVSLRLLTTQQVMLPSSHFGFQNGSRVTITIVTQYAAAWAGYFRSVPAFAPLVSCAPISCAAFASTFYTTGSTLGTITLSVPTSGLKFALLVGTFAISVV